MNNGFQLRQAEQRMSMRSVEVNSRMELTGHRPRIRLIFSSRLDTDHAGHYGTPVRYAERHQQRIVDFMIAMTFSNVGLVHNWRTEAMLTHALLLRAQA